MYRHFTALSEENSLLRLAIHRALLTRLEPGHGDWWLPLEEVMGINPKPPPVKIEAASGEWRGFAEEAGILSSCSRGSGSKIL